MDTLEHTMGDDKEKTLRIVGNRNNTGMMGRVKSIGTAAKNAEFGKDILLAEGSLLITFTPAYLDSLGAGEHLLRVVFEDGETSFLIRILAAEVTAPQSPTTGDGFPMIPITVVMLISLAGAAAMVLYRKRIVVK